MPLPACVFTTELVLPVSNDPVEFAVDVIAKRFLFLKPFPLL